MSSSVSTPIFEICTVDVIIVRNGGCIGILNPFNKLTWVWIANATGKDGSYIAAESSEFRAFGDKQLGPMAAMGRTSTESEIAHNELISKLLQAGWEPLDTRYRQQTFRRRLQ